VTSEHQENFSFFINYTYLFIIQLISSIYIYVNLLIKDQY